MRTIIVLLLGLFAVGACDETAAGVQRRYVERHREGFVYEGTTRELVLRAARGLFADRGQTLRPGGDADTFVTEPHRDSYGTQQYILRFVDLRWRQGFMVHITNRTTYEDGTGDGSRDGELEWQLIQRADPDRAADIMSDANETADKVPPRVHRVPDGKREQ